MLDAICECLDEEMEGDFVHVNAADGTTRPGCRAIKGKGYEVENQDREFPSFDTDA